MVRKKQPLCNSGLLYNRLPVITPTSTEATGATWGDATLWLYANKANVTDTWNSSVSFKQPCMISGYRIRHAVFRNEGKEMFGGGSVQTGFSDSEACDCLTLPALTEEVLLYLKSTGFWTVSKGTLPW